jgi:hypothetical protein
VEERHNKIRTRTKKQSDAEDEMFLKIDIYSVLNKKRKSGGLFHAPFLGDLHHEENHESNDDEGYQRHQETADPKDLTVNCRS